MLPQYMASLREHNICGSVLATCSLPELKPVLQMSFGDWELFRSITMQLRDRDSMMDETDTAPPHVKFSQNTNNMDDSVHTPQARYSDTNRRRRTAGSKFLPTGMDPESFSSQVPRNESMHFKPKPMKRKDSFLGQVIMESELLRGVVAAAGVCTDSEDDILEEEELTTDADQPGTSAQISNHMADHYTKLKQQQDHQANQHAIFALGYRSTDESDTEELPTVKSTKSFKKTSSKISNSITSGSISSPERNSKSSFKVGHQKSSRKDVTSPKVDVAEDHTPLLSVKAKSIEKLRHLFSSSRSKSTVVDDESQRTSMCSSVLSQTEMDQLGSSLAELSDFDPTSSSEYLALRKISQKEDPNAPSAFKSVTPCSSRASSRASSLAAVPPFQKISLSEECSGIQGAEAGGQRTAVAFRKSLSHKSLVEEDGSKQEDCDTHSKASLEEIRIELLDKYDGKPEVYL